MEIQEKLKKQDEHISQYIYEREKELKALNISILSRQPTMFIGLPGIAKSEMAHGKFSYFEGKKYYNNCHSYTVPSELVGAQIVEKMKHGIIETNIEDMIPDCHFITLDEVFKVAKSLSCLLPVLNERLFKNGNKLINIPLITAVLISNELPSDPEIKGAFFDRCPRRFEVKPIESKENRIKLLKKSSLPKFKPDQSLMITLDELYAAQKIVDQIDIPCDVSDCLDDIFNAVNVNGIFVSDRQFYQFGILAKSEAFLNGRSQVSIDDLHIFADSMWHEPKQRKIVAEIVNSFCNQEAIEMNEKFDLASSVYASWKEAAQNANHKEFSARMKEIRVDFEALKVKEHNAADYGKMKGKIITMHGEMMKFALQQMKLGK